MFRRISVIALIVAGLTTGVAVAGGGGSQKFELLGPNGNVFCNGGVISGAPGGFGFAVINAPGNDTVAATVSLKGLTPNTTYFVGLIQGVSDCVTDDGTITTNGQGNGTVHLSEPSVSTHAVVGVCTTVICAQPPAGEVYVTDTYNH
jgi:hypothetical protein